jgi:hypothetical protein
VLGRARKVSGPILSGAGGKPMPGLHHVTAIAGPAHF